MFSGFNRDWFLGLLLVLAVVVTYTPVWQAGFIWDDNMQLMSNPCIVGPLGLKEIWTTSYSGYYPLVLTTFWVEHALWGLRPLPYHLVNVLLHGICAVLLWRVLRSLQVPGAWLGAALWVLHPVQVETAAWITELKNTQSGLFYLLAILFFVEGLKSKTADDRTSENRNYGLTLLCSALAMASKPSTVILPLVLGLCAWWVEGRCRWRTVARLAPIALMTLLSSALTLWTQKPQSAVDLRWTRSWPERLVTSGDAVWFYLGKLIWPHSLIFIYPRWEVDVHSALSWLPLLAVIIVLLILWWKRETWARPYFFAFAYFLVALFPVLGLVDGFFWRFSLVGDHFQYLASMGPLALAGAGLTTLADLVIPRKTGWRTAFAAGLLLILGQLSWQRVWAYESPDTLWTDTLAQNPTCWLALNNLGNLLCDRGQVDAAIVEFQKALAIDPNFDDAHSNLGIALSQQGHLDEAIAQFREALRCNPKHAIAHNNLGIALARKGRNDEALAEFEKAVDAASNFANAHYNLGVALLQKGEVDPAIEQFHDVLKINPGNGETHSNLGYALFKKGRVDEAIEQYQETLKIDPKAARAHSNLGDAFMKKGRVDEAIEQYHEAILLNGNLVDAHTGLGLALLPQGQVDEAIAQFQEALEITPQDPQVRTNLGLALLQKGRVDEALIQFKAAVRLKPGDVDYQNNLAKAQAMVRPAADSK